MIKNNLHVVCIIQARLGNTRLPSKVLMDIEGKPMLQRVQEQVLKCKLINTIVIASSNPELNKYNLNGVEFFCDTTISESDVLKRTYEAAYLNGADIVVRVTSDCPLVVPELVDLMIATAIKNDVPYMSIKGLEGIFGEVFSFNMLKTANDVAVTDYEREHVTPYIKSMVECMETKRMYLDDYKFSVDTLADLNNVCGLVKILKKLQ